MLSISKATKAMTGLSRARVFRTTTTTTPRRPLTSLTMAFANIAAWKARRAAAATSSTSPLPTTTTTLHSAIAGPPFSRRLLAPEEPSNPNERSASEIHDVPSLHVLGKLHTGSRNSGPAPLLAPAPAPAPAAPATPDKPSKSNKTVPPKSTLANGLETLRRLGDTLSGWGKDGSGKGTSGSSTSGVSAVPMVGGVPLDGDVAVEKQAGKKLEFQRELPMFLGGGLY